MTNTMHVSHYVVRPTEPDGDIVAYRFATADETLDFICDTLAGEYGYDDVDVDGIHALGFCPSVYQRRRNHGEKHCPGHTIATIEIVADN
jgi:hypothetical protein